MSRPSDTSRIRIELDKVDQVQVVIAAQRELIKRLDAHAADLRSENQHLIVERDHLKAKLDKLLSRIRYKIDFDDAKLLGMEFLPADDQQAATIRKLKTQLSWAKGTIASLRDEPSSTFHNTYEEWMQNLADWVQDGDRDD